MVKRAKTVKADEGARLGVRLPVEVRKGLERLAADDGRTLSSYVQRLLTEHVRTAASGSRKR
jgi:predicted DNA-binding protein